MKKSVALLLCALLGLALALPAAAAGPFTVSNPYKDVIWSGTGAWGAYKANLHTHTTFSDGDEDLKTMVEAYYDKGYDVLAVTDHGVVEKPWDQKPMTVPPFDIQNWLNPHEVLSSARLAEIAAGTDRNGRGMIMVPQGLELNCATAYKSHVIGLYGGWGQGWIGISANYRPCIAGTQRRGGVTFIAHPGDWIKSEFNPDAAKDPANVNFYAGILRDYPSCLGIEVYNSTDGVTRYDRLLWDELLMRLVPEKRMVWGFSNDDSHNLGDIDLNAELLFMPAGATADDVRTCLESGAFLARTRKDRLLEINADKALPFPGVTNIQVAGETITLTPDEATLVEWIADGSVIETGNSIDLRAHAEEITCYVRARIVGPGGVALTQPFAVDKGVGYKHPDDALQGWDLAKWYIHMYATKNIFGWLIENVAKLFK